MPRAQRVQPRPRRHALEVVVLLGVVASLATAVMAHRLLQQPGIRVVNPERNLGVVGLGTNPTVDFTLENTGGATLELAIGPLPRGLRLVHADTSVEPGGVGRVRVELNTFDVGGNTQWTASVKTNDPSQPSVDLAIKADVRTFLVIAPPAARFTFVQHEAEGGTKHVIAAVDDVELAVLGVESPFPFIRPTWRELRTSERRSDLSSGRQWQIDLTISSQAPVGPIADYVIVRTSHPQQPRAFLPVSGFVRPLFAVTPPSLHLPAVAPRGDGKPVASLVVKNFATREIPITSVTTDVPGLTTTLVEVQSGREWRVEIGLADGGKAGPFTGTLQLVTRSPHVPKLVVPFSGERVGSR
jgi:hypothetical protein